MKKKLLFLIPTLQGGGAEKVLIDLVNNLNPQKYDITVQTYLKGGVFEDKLSSKIRYKTIIPFKNEFLRHLFMYVISFLLPQKFIYNVFINDNYDIEIAYLEGIATKTIASSVNVRSKKIAFVHTDFSKNYLLSKIYKTYNDCLVSYQIFDEVVYVSNNVKEGFEKTIGKLSKTSVIHNVVDNKVIIKAATEKILHKKPNKFLFVSIGRLSNEKGYDRLIEAASLLNKRNYEYEIWIIGEGNEREHLENLIYNYNINNIKLLGFKKNPYPYISLSDMLICSSRVEGYSTVVTEALILQTPVLTTNCSGMNEILGNGNYGKIVDNSVEGIYHGMKEILDLSKEYNRYLMMAKQRSDFFSVDKNILRYEDLFDGGKNDGD